jgi:NTE family protein
MTTAFVLSGGGSLGAVQVGMLQALGDRGIRPDLLVGTSAGALNALWVADHGMSPESLAALARIWEGLRRSDIFPVRPAGVVNGLRGRTLAVSSSHKLAALVSAHATIDDVEDATVPLHLIATDLLNGREVVISAGPVTEAVRASAAIPGVFPPVWFDDRWLVDGALAPRSGVSHAGHLGADVVYVLPAGVPCALERPPRSAIGVAMHALTLLIEHRLFADVLEPPPGVEIRLLPPLCPLKVSAGDFSRASGLIDRGRRASAQWLDEGGVDLPHQARFLSLHDHRPTDSPAPSSAGS